MGRSSLTSYFGLMSCLGRRCPQWRAMAETTGVEQPTRVLTSRLHFCPAREHETRNRDVAFVRMHACVRAWMCAYVCAFVLLCWVRSSHRLQRYKSDHWRGRSVSLT